jgi:large subunit ribosomal protein L10
MDEPRAEKVAVVDEVRERLAGSSASVITEYRGLTVAEMASLRQAVGALGGDFKVFKNTLVRRAIVGSGHEALADFLEGPTAIAFVTGDVSAVAKTLREFSRSNPLLVLKGGMFEGALLSSADLAALADLPSRDVLLSRFAGGLAAPLQQLASLLSALPRNLAFGLSALVDQRRASGSEPNVTEVPASSATDPDADASASAAEAVDDAVATSDAVATRAADAVEETSQPTDSDDTIASA